MKNINFIKNIFILSLGFMAILPQADAMQNLTPKKRVLSSSDEEVDHPPAKRRKLDTSFLAITVVDNCCIECNDELEEEIIFRNLSESPYHDSILPFCCTHVVHKNCAQKMLKQSNCERDIKAKNYEITTIEEGFNDSTDKQRIILMVKIFDEDVCSAFNGSPKEPVIYKIKLTILEINGQYYICPKETTIYLSELVDKKLNERTMPIGVTSKIEIRPADTEFMSYSKDPYKESFLISVQETRCPKCSTLAKRNALTEEMRPDHEKQKSDLICNICDSDDENCEFFSNKVI